MRDAGRAGHRGHAPQECSWERRDGLFPDVSHFFQYFPFRGQIGPDSKLKARHTEIVSRKFSDPVTIRPNSSHVQFLEYRHASRQGLCRQKRPEQVCSAVIPKWYMGITRAGKRQMSSNLPGAIALVLRPNRQIRREGCEAQPTVKEWTNPGCRGWGIQKLQWLPQSSRRPNRRPIRIRFRAKAR